VPDAVMVAACRTAIGTARRGSLVDADPFDLARHTVAAAVTRSGLAPELFDEVILGAALAGGGEIARYAAIQAGLIDVAGTAMNRHCASGLAAVSSAAASIRGGMDRAVVAGGVQSMSLSPRTARRVPGTDEWDDGWMSPSHPNSAEAPNMGLLPCAPVAA